MENHPNDPNGNWDYDSKPNVEEYFEEDGNLNRYSKDYETWENDQSSNE